MTGLCLTKGFWPFLVFATVAAIAQSTGPAARGPLVKHYGGDRPAEFRAYLRSVTNVGIAFGAVLAGFGIQDGSRDAYLVLLAGSAVCSAAAAATVLLLPALAAEPSRPGRRWIALRDRPYLALTLLDGVMAIQFRVLTAAIPLWLLSRTHAPRWSVSAVMLVNTAIVVVLQVRASKSIDNPRAGGVAFRRAGFAFLASCVIFSALASVPSWLAVTLVLAGVVVHTIGEIWQSAGGFELSFAMAPQQAVGQYQGLFGMGLGLGVTIGPALLIGLCIDWGTPGWWVVGGIFAATGLAVPAVVAWSERLAAAGERAPAPPEPVSPTGITASDL
ncbi:MFS transporter [Catenulispora yoronensis]